MNPTPISSTGPSLGRLRAKGAALCAEAPTSQNASPLPGATPTAETSQSRAVGGQLTAAAGLTTPADTSTPSRASRRGEGAFYPVIDTFTVDRHAEALAAYEAIQRDYDRAVTLRQSKLIGELYPRVRAAKMALLAVECGRG